MAFSNYPRSLTKDDTRKWDYDTYFTNSGEQVWTILNGVKYWLPSRTSLRQQLLMEVVSRLNLFVEERNAGEVILSPFDVILDPWNVVQPDIVFIGSENLGKLKDKGLFGSPDLCVELIESWSVTMDSVIKKSLYERFGVKEYWIVFPAERAIEIFTLEDGKYVLASHCDGEGSVTSLLLPGLRIAVNDLWKEEA